MVLKTTGYNHFYDYLRIKASWLTKVELKIINFAKFIKFKNIIYLQIFFFAFNFHNLKKKGGKINSNFWGKNQFGFFRSLGVKKRGKRIRFPNFYCIQIVKHFCSS